MASSARIFLAGVGTTFAIFAIGFGGGLFLAKSALSDPPTQTRASSGSSPDIRVILPASAEPALQVTTAIPAPEPQPVPVLHVPAEKQVAQADPKKAEKDAKAERRRHAERKARRMAAAERARQRSEPLRHEPRIMAFGGDEQRNFFGN
jgi:hypothetical protein